MRSDPIVDESLSRDCPLESIYGLGVMVLPPAIGTAATTDGTIERFIVVGMNL
ncbi:MAG: hypothetical protein IGR76_00075 [Synechococcales cyanobacterium T60_A2020_003]|nr:hypothetical protein [Synechococcales cyanobacterium T60_A2020_003]